MSQEAFIAEIAKSLDTVGIPFMIAGSHASSYYGRARTTNDVDFVADPKSDQLERFLNLLGDRYYFSPEAAREALRARTIFNVIQFAEGWKADFIVRKQRPFSVEELRRRETVNLHGVSIPIASAEDVILSKLEWNLITPSERQLQDALHVAVVQATKLDLAYLRTWAPQLGVAEALADLLRQAAAMQLPASPSGE
ncbi:MAG: hypothetical protein HY040_29110 [Planctomycetes bacterium]|nr:hypothetical protein [Planctomycetota bacterium]